jgi:hypothetical protein
LDGILEKAVHGLVLVGDDDVLDAVLLLGGYFPSFLIWMVTASLHFLRASPVGLV